VRHAASLVDAKDPGATVACAMAKRLATDIGFQVRPATAHPPSGKTEEVSYRTQRRGVLRPEKERLVQVGS
jgi:hypothetical protein